MVSYRVVQSHEHYSYSSYTAFPLPVRRHLQILLNAYHGEKEAITSIGRSTRHLGIGDASTRPTSTPSLRIEPTSHTQRTSSEQKTTLQTWHISRATWKPMGQTKSQSTPACVHRKRHARSSIPSHTSTTRATSACIASAWLQGTDTSTASTAFDCANPSSKTRQRAISFAATSNTVCTPARCFVVNTQSFSSGIRLDTSGFCYSVCPKCDGWHTSRSRWKVSVNSLLRTLSRSFHHLV